MMKVIASVALLAIANGQSVYVVRDSYKGSRMVSTASSCKHGRVEIFDTQYDYDWGTFANCGYYDWDDTATNVLCTGLGFTYQTTDTDNSNEYYTGETSFEYSTSYTAAGQIPTYCVGEDAFCSILDTSFCEDCWIYNTWDATSSCSDTSLTCHTYDVFVYCAGTTSRDCELLTDASTQSGKDCESGYWSDIASALATIFIVLIVIGVVIFLGIIGCIVCCVCGGIACCAASAKKNNP